MQVYTKARVWHYEPWDWEEKTTFSMMWIMLGLVIVLNVLDALFTVFWVEARLATEANPLMAVLLESSPVLFVLGKSALVGAGCVLLWGYRHTRMAFVATAGVSLLYLFLFCYHLLALSVFLS